MSFPDVKTKMGTLRMTSITGDYSGFSLIELIVVLGVISSITLVSSLYFQNHLSQTLLKASARELSSTLIWARRLAITKREIHKVVFSPQRQRYWIENVRADQVEGVNYLKQGIVFANPGLGKWGEVDGVIEGGILDNAFSFYPQGTAEGGSIYLQDEGKKNWYTVTITPTTGGITVYPGKH